MLYFTSQKFLHPHTCLLDHGPAFSSLGIPVGAPSVCNESTPVKFIQPSDTQTHRQHKAQTEHHASCQHNAHTHSQLSSPHTHISCLPPLLFWLLSPCLSPLLLLVLVIVASPFKRDDPELHSPSLQCMCVSRSRFYASVCVCVYRSVWCPDGQPAGCRTVRLTVERPINTNSSSLSLCSITWHEWMPCLSLRPVCVCVYMCVCCVFVCYWAMPERHVDRCVHVSFKCRSIAFDGSIVVVVVLVVVVTNWKGLQSKYLWFSLMLPVLQCPYFIWKVWKTLLIHQLYCSFKTHTTQSIERSTSCHGTPSKTSGCRPWWLAVV